MDARLASLDTDDMDAAAMVRRIALAERLPFLPDLHTTEEDAAYWRSNLLANGQVFGAWAGGTLAGVIAYGDGWIHQLYVLPEFQRQGIGSALLAQAAQDMGDIRLWTFQRNVLARGFYEHHGFQPVEQTDGRGNEEREPDILYYKQQDNAA
jgi:GNAT superfamily N-acetyltransferase